jgi:endonuclease/exonuclease/phosphatase (EEP) superfamily protein YafD
VAAGAGALAVVNLALIVPLYWPVERTAGDPPITRAMSLNLYHHNRQHARVLALIREEKPDFVLLLEVTPEWARALRPLNQDYRYSRVLPHARDSGGMALYSRLPIESLEVPGQEDNRLPVRIALPSGNLTLLCAHPSSPSSSWDFGWRNVELDLMANWAAVQPGPLMVLGDLNTTSWSPYFADFMAASGLRDSRQGFGVQATWPALPAVLRIPIDHCLVSSQIAVFDRRVGPAVGSDHRPIIVDFTIVEPTE